MNEDNENCWVEILFNKKEYFLKDCPVRTNVNIFLEIFSEELFDYEKSIFINIFLRTSNQKKKQFLRLPSKGPSHQKAKILKKIRKDFSIIGHGFLIIFSGLLSNQNMKKIFSQGSSAYHTRIYQENILEDCKNSK